MHSICRLLHHELTLLLSCWLCRSCCNEWFGHRLYELGAFQPECPLCRQVDEDVQPSQTALKALEEIQQHRLQLASDVDASSDDDGSDDGDGDSSEGEAAGSDGDNVSGSGEEDDDDDDGMEAESDASASVAGSSMTAVAAAPPAGSSAGAQQH